MKRFIRTIKKTSVFLLIVIWVFSGLLLVLVELANAAVSVTPVAGGGAISADTTGGSYTTLTGPTISEGVNRDIGTGTIVLNAPSGFEFNTGATVTAAITLIEGNKACFAFSSNNATPTSTTITFTVTSQDGAGGNPATRCRVDFSNIQVRPVAGTPLASGDITQNGTAAGVPATGYGTLTEVVGAKSQLAITTEPSSTAALNTDFITKPVVELQDQFGNTVTTDNTSTVTRTAVLSTQSCGGTAGSGTLSSTPSSGAAVSLGVMTYTAMQYSAVESIKICFSSSGVTSALSGAITVSSAPTVSTQTASAIEAITATCNGTIETTGGQNATSRGCEWDTDSGAPYANSASDTGDYTAGTFTKGLTGLPTGTTIYARAFATNLSGTGYGNEIFFLTKPAAPGTPTFTNIATSSVTVNWSTSTGAASYKIERCQGTGCSGFSEIQAGETNNYYNDSNLSQATVYRYRIRATNATGDSAYSGADEFTTDSIPVTFAQQDFRWFQNSNVLDPPLIDALALENASISSVISGNVLRLRMNISLGGSTLSALAQAFDLQFAEKGGASSCADVPGGNYANVGSPASSSVFRGYVNGGVSDGDTVSALRLSNSTTAESYEDQNSSASNPNELSVGNYGEWDWVVRNNGAKSATSYCFRMVKQGGAALNSYQNYPELTTYSPATWKDAQDAPINNVRPNESMRLRIEVSNEGGGGASHSYRLEFTNSLAGPWTAVPVDPACTSTSQAVRICPSNYYVDLDRTTNRLTAEGATFVSGYMLDDSNPASSLTLNADEFTELEWKIQMTDSAPDGDYYFRVTDNGTALGYSEFPKLTLVTSAKFAQNYFYFFADNDSITPADPWPSGAGDVGELGAITSTDDPVVYGDIVRLRISATIGEVGLAAASQSVTLQFGERITTCGAIDQGSWSNLGNIGSGSLWRGYNSSPSDGSALSGNPPTAGDLKLSVSDRAGTYEKQNNSALNPFQVSIGEDVEYDWVMQYNASESNKTYCFRMVYSDGRTFENGYNNYPRITTAPFDIRSQRWQWFDDEINENPTLELASENVAPSPILNGNVIKLRVALAEVAGVAGTNVKFKIQFSQLSDFSSGVYDVVEQGSCVGNSSWCYGNGVDNDDDPVLSRKLSDTTANGRHNESGVSLSTFDPAAGTSTEYEFTLKMSGAPANTVYFFRAYDVTNNEAVPLNTDEVYPSVVTGGTELTFSISGINSGISIEGATTDVSTTPTSAAFGSLAYGTPVNAAQRLTVSTNAASGYSVFVYQRNGLSSTGGAEIASVSASNEIPLAWGTACLISADGCYGYHAGDNLLSGGSARFAPDDTFAAFGYSPKEVVSSASSVSDENTDMLYRVVARQSQPAGIYENSVVYIIVPSF